MASERLWTQSGLAFVLAVSITVLALMSVPVAAQQMGTSVAQAAPKVEEKADAKPEARSATEASKAPSEPSWLERQWQAITALFSPPNAASGAQVANKGPAAGPPPAVSVSRPLAKDIVEWDEYTGRVDAVDTVEMRARVSGYLTEVHFKDGQMVKKGDLLFSLDARPFERALDQAKAELALAQQRVANASKDVERAQPLMKNRFITEKTFDDRQNVYDEAQANVRVSDAKVKSAELDLSFTKIYAPLTGRISRTNVSIGNYVIGGAQVSTLLTTIVTQDPVQVYFDVSENNLIKYKRFEQQGKSVGATDTGVPVFIALADETSFPHQGKLDFIDNRLDASTGTLRVRAQIDNPKGLFSPGMFVRVRIAGSSAYKGLLVPDEAIGTDQSDKFVYVVDAEGIATRRKITIGSISDGLRIVRSGLNPGDQVIVRGIQRARPGQKVTPKLEPIKVSQDAPPASTSMPVKQ